MKAPKLWVWNGSPDDKMDVLRYVSATEDDVLSQPCVEEVCASIQNAWKVKHKADLAASDATIEKLWALARKMAGDTAKAQWTDDDEEMRLLFLRAVDDGDLETACAALGVEDMWRAQQKERKNV